MPPSATAPLLTPRLTDPSQLRTPEEQKSLWTSSVDQAFQTGLSNRLQTDVKDGGVRTTLMSHLDLFDVRGMNCHHQNTIFHVWFLTVDQMGGGSVKANRPDFVSWCLSPQILRLASLLQTVGSFRLSLLRVENSLHSGLEENSSLFHHFCRAYLAEEFDRGFR